MAIEQSRVPRCDFDGQDEQGWMTSRICSGVDGDDQHNVAQSLQEKVVGAACLLCVPGPVS
jgi:hypothetical protein